MFLHSLVNNIFPLIQYLHIEIFSQYTLYYTNYDLLYITYYQVDRSEIYSFVEK